MRKKIWILKHNYAQKGSALVAVLLVMVVVSLLGMTLLTVTTSNFKMTSMERDYQAVYYIAEAGINYEMNEITSNIESLYKDSTDIDDFFNTFESEYPSETRNDSFESVLGVTPYANINLSGNRLGNITTYTIESTGYIRERSRTVSANFEIRWIPKSGFNIPNDMAIFSNTTITMPNGTINGSVGTNSILPNSIQLSGGGHLLMVKYMLDLGQMKKF